MNNVDTPVTMASSSLTETGEPMLDMYLSMYRIRLTEETLADRYKEQEMRTPAHFGIGQEAVAVGVTQALRPSDAVYSHHRCHNHYLAMGGGVAELAAELYGRETGAARGRGGSVHLTARDKGFVISSAILGQTIAVACGSGWAFRMDGTDNVAVTFFGEAACEEGIFYETVNFAAVNKVPVIFVCENNGYSTESPLSVRQPEGTRLCERVESFKVPAREVDGNDVGAIFEQAQAAVERARGGGGPTFLECETYRLREHVGPYFDYELDRTYRTREEVERWMEKCPLARARRQVLDAGLIEAAALETEEARLRDAIAGEITASRNDPWPAVETLFDGVA